MSDNIDEYINTLTPLKFNNTKKTEIQGFINTAISALEAEQAKIETIRKTLENNEYGWVNTTTKNQYIKYLDYIYNLIEAKKTKDNSIMKLLELSFNGINTSILSIQGMKEQLRGNKLKELIPLKDVNEYTLNLDKNTANALGEGYKENQKLTIENINNAIQNMIATCQTNIEEYIREFQKKLTQTEQAEQADIKTGGEYNELGYGESNDSKQKIDEYKIKLTTIKETYEKALKDDIKDYKNLCDLLTKMDGGLLNNINISVQILRKNSNKLSQKMGLNLDKLLDPDPFEENKNLFFNLIEMVNTTKTGLLKSELSGSPSHINFPSTPANELLDDSDNDEPDPLIGRSTRRALTRVPYNIENLTALTAQDLGTNSRGLGALQNTLYNSDFNKLVNAALQNVQARGQVKETYTDTELARKVQKEMKTDSNFLSKLNEENNKKLTGMSVDEINEKIMETITDNKDRLDIIKALKTQGQSGGYKKKSKSKRMTSKKTSMKVAKKTSSKEKENKNKNKKIVKSYSKSKSKKQSGGFIRGGVLFPQDFYDTSTVM